MLFAERKTEKGWSYETEDVFGTVRLESSVRLDGGTLDDVTLHLVTKGPLAARVAGDMTHPGGTLSYELVRRPAWDEEEESPNA